MSRWEESFVAMSVLLDVPVQEAVTSLDANGVRRAQAMVRALESSSKLDRANGLARGIADVVHALGELAP